MKKLMSLVLAFMLCFSFSVPAEAVSFPGGEVQPYDDIAGQTTSVLIVNGTTATCMSTCHGDSEVVKIVGEQYLQKEGFLWIWTTYDGAEWKETAYSDKLSMTNTKTGLTDGKYRLKSVFTLTYREGKTETITVYSDERIV